MGMKQLTRGQVLCAGIIFGWFINNVFLAATGYFG